MRKMHTKMEKNYDKRCCVPSPREYTLNPDIFLVRMDLGRLSKAGLYTGKSV